MTSYIKILQKLDAFCTAHLQIKKFMGEFREQMPNFSTMDERYPIVFASPISDVEDLNTNQFTLEIYCVDIIQKDRANLNTIVSDCHLILKDLFIYYRDDNDADLDVVGTASISFVNNFDLDYVAGAVMTITFEVAGYGSCEIPMLPITPTHNDCEPATLIVRDSDDNVLYTLTVDSGATETQVIADSTYLVEYENGTPIESGSILAEGSAVIQVPNPIVCADATYTITDDSANVLYSGNIASGGSLNQSIADSTAVLKDTANVTISTTSINAEGSANITAPDATVENSNATYTDSVVSGGTLVLPDITVTDSDGSTYTQPSVENVVCTLSPDTSLEVNGTPEGTFAAGSTIEVNITDGVNPVTPNDVTVVGDVVTIEVPAATAAPVGATLMQTGQTTVYRTGDDADTRSEGRATDFFTLASNNPFGSTARFTDELGGSTYANDWVIDWSTYNGATVLGYYRVFQPNTAWNAAIDASLATFGTFANCRMANLTELQNIQNVNSVGTFIYAPFLLGGGATVQTSTTNPNNTAFSFTISSTVPTVGVTAKTTAVRYMVVRTFTVTGTTLT
jgi:hypothetical protein